MRYKLSRYHNICITKGHSLRSALFVGMGRQPVRAQCGYSRYPFTLLGIASAVNPVPFLSAWADSQCVPGAAIVVTRSLCSVSLLRWSDYSLALRCGVAALPPPLGEVPTESSNSVGGEGRFPGSCPLSHALRRASSPRGRAKAASRRIPYAERKQATGRGAQRMLFDRCSL